jgi:septal ring factor EnvC (AmiA/AmiB activator)
MMAALTLAIGVPGSSSADPSLGSLHQQLQATQAHAGQLQASLSGLSQLIAGLAGQITLVRGREAAVSADLARDRAALASASAALERERVLLGRLRRRLAFARLLLARQLVSGYESGNPDLVEVVMQADGFRDLLERLTYLRDAQRRQQGIITLTRAARARADAAARRLAAMQRADRALTQATALRQRALAGMNSLLSAKQASLQRAQEIQRAALDAARSRSGAIRSQIAHIEAEQAAARAAYHSGPALEPSGGWAIPYAIVLCESGGQNLPPNGAGASGYYQILPSTWKLFGGTGPAAYLASKAEQDAVASRIWDGGAGASNWVCAAIVGIR